MQTIHVTSPFDGLVVGQVRLNSHQQVQEAINLAHEKFSHEELPKYKRVQILEKLAAIMSEQKVALTKLCASEGGKPWMDSQVEVDRAIGGVKLAIEALNSLEGKEIAMGQTQSSMGRIAFTTHEPIGVVASISAFNHPLNLAIHQVIPAIAAGCPVIIKPASKTPLSAIRLVELLGEAGLPEGWAQAVVCDRQGAELLATSPKIAYLSFIGSANVGWKLRSIVAPGTRVVLEHGGVAPVVVEADANIDELIPSIAKGGFYHGGQVCVSVQKVFVHESICDEVANKLANYASKLIVGNQLDSKTEVGPLISTHEVQRVDEWVKEAVKEGGKILTGGQKICDTCYAPTVILNPSDKALVSTKEVFGPVVCIYSYKDLNEAIKRANALEFSFQAAIFTKDIDTAFYASKRLNATAVMINDHTAFRVDWMPFGGAKSSGLGVGGIGYSIKDMSSEKLIVIKSNAL